MKWPAEQSTERKGTDQRKCAEERSDCEFDQSFMWWQDKKKNSTEESSISRTWNPGSWEDNIRNSVRD